MPFIVTREDGKMVARPGHHRSYTADPRLARTWDSREAAERERCGNETVVDTRDLFGR